MTRYLLDTNIISNAAKPTPNSFLASWLAEQEDDDLFIAAMTVAEIQRGILLLPTGQKRTALELWFSGSEGLLEIFADRILPFDDRAALAWAKLMADGQRTGRARSPLDMILAATADVNGCIVATDNDRDFFGLRAINPMRLAE